MTTHESSTPRRQGYRLPAEWEEHSATWLAWPRNPADWPGKFQPIPWVYCEIVRHLTQGEQVHIAVEHERAKERARRQLARAGVRLERVHFHTWPTNRVWTRDSGPIFLKKTVPEPGPPQPHSAALQGGLSSRRALNDASSLAILDWKFNAWAKYDDWQLDDRLPSRVADLLGLPTWAPYFPPGVEHSGTGRRVVLEGGSIDVNGSGALLTTEECLLSETQQRNPGLSRADLEIVFHEYLGIDQVLWMDRGIAGDDTHGHVDDITRFVSPATIVTVVEPNPADENHLPLAQNLERLHAARNLEGRPYKIVELPMPAPVVFAGQRLPASYANFYVANHAVLVPTFNDPADRHALNTLAGLFPGRAAIGIHARDLVWGLGALHCLTQQQPTG